MIDRVYRSSVLGVAGRKPVEDLVRARAWPVARRFVAGELSADAIRAGRELQQGGVLANFDLLGEFVSTPERADEFTESVLALLDECEKEGWPSPYLSVKLSSVGQGQTVNGGDLGLSNARRILTRATGLGGFVNLDMEDHPRVNQTLEQFRTLVGEYGHQHVGTVLQSYLYRSEQDRAALADLKPNLRFVKGAYLEPVSVAMPDKQEVDAAYRRLVYASLLGGGYTNVATHDERIIADVKAFVAKHGVDRASFEFQLLYGIRRDLQQQLAQDGYRVRAYIPYGREWYAYFSRRIAERPANVMFVLRGLLKG